MKKRKKKKKKKAENAHLSSSSVYICNADREGT